MIPMQIPVSYADRLESDTMYDIFQSVTTLMNNSNKEHTEQTC